jgi:hypothetical protein
MHTIPPKELAVKISKIINNNKNILKQFQDRHGKINFNLLVGLVLGSICSFADKPMINQVFKMFIVAFNDKQLDDYGNFMMGLNNYLVYTLDTNYKDIYLLENNQWNIIHEANFDSVYALWYAYFGIMKVEFKNKAGDIQKLKQHNKIVNEALECFNAMSSIMEAGLLDANALYDMQNKFPEYAYKFNELRKLIYMQNDAPKPTLH